MREDSKGTVQTQAVAGSDEGKHLILQDLTNELSRLAGYLHRAVRTHESAFAFGPAKAEAAQTLSLRKTRPPLPNPRLIRKIIRQRQLRAQYFDRGLFADPAWDILLDLAAAAAEHKRISITSACTAAGVPPTTALRWIGELINTGLVERTEDVTDRRRAFVALTDRGSRAVARFFADMGADAVHFL